MAWIRVLIFILSKLYEKVIWAGWCLYSRVTSYLWSLNTVMQGNVARPRAGVGGTHEAPSHSGGHTGTCTRRVREDANQSLCGFQNKVIYAMYSCDHKKGFIFAVFLMWWGVPGIFIITLLPYDRWGNRICQLLFKTEHWKYTFPFNG